MSGASNSSSFPQASPTRSTSPRVLNSSELELIEQLKRRAATGDSAVYGGEQQTGELPNRLQYAELKIRVLEERLRLLRLAKYGTGSEKLSDAQLELLEPEPGVSNLEVETGSKRKAISSSPKKPARKHRGRQQLPAHLRRVEQVLDCAPDQPVVPAAAKRRW